MFTTCYPEYAFYFPPTPENLTWPGSANPPPSPGRHGSGQERTRTSWLLLDHFTSSCVTPFFTSAPRSGGMGDIGRRGSVQTHHHNQCTADRGSHCADASWAADRAVTGPAQWVARKVAGFLYSSMTDGNWSSNKDIWMLSWDSLWTIQYVSSTTHGNWKFWITDKLTQTYINEFDATLITFFVIKELQNE